MAQTSKKIIMEIDGRAKFVYHLLKAGIQKGSLCEIILNRPHRLNAIDIALEH